MSTSVPINLNQRRGGRMMASTLTAIGALAEIRANLTNPLQMVRCGLPLEVRKEIADLVREPFADAAKLIFVPTPSALEQGPDLEHELRLARTLYLAAWMDLGAVTDTVSARYAARA